MKWLLLMASIVKVAFFPSAIPTLVNQDSFTFLPNGLMMNAPTSKAIAFGLPVKLTIPGIGVDAAVEYVGLTSRGAMDVPKDPHQVGWFTVGPRPGETGTAAIAGHFGWKNRIPVVFDDLHLLHQGDKVYVTDEYGAIITFVVRDIRRYGQKDDASAVFAVSEPGAHLNLITCGGVWDAAQKSYSYRLVVFTDRVE